MNELLAIILIVFICCAMFLAWLISMATCPDRMVNLISSGTGSSTSSSRNESCELVPKDEEKGEIGPEMDTIHFKPLIKSTSKKLSVVPEQDEQLTLQSTKAPPRPTIFESGYAVENEVDYPQPMQFAPRLISRYSESHIDQIDESNAEDGCYDPEPIVLQPVTLPARIPLSSGGPVAPHQPYSKVGDRVFKCYSVGFVNQAQIN
uniref:Secreted protein n=1 Tax=Panagrolaimus sp. JU765 TaxID=591449 RepID=A0AC34RJR3_9BILA